MSDLKIVPIGNKPEVEVDPKAVLEIMETAREALEKLGVTDYVQLSLVGDGHIVDNYKIQRDPYLLIGALDVIKQDLNLSLIVGREGE